MTGEGKGSYVRSSGGHVEVERRIRGSGRLKQAMSSATQSALTTVCASVLLQYTAKPKTRYHRTSGKISRVPYARLQASHSRSNVDEPRP